MPSFKFNRKAFVQFCNAEGYYYYADFQGDGDTESYNLDNMLCQAEFTWKGKPVRVGAVSTGENGYITVGNLLAVRLWAGEEDFPQDPDMDPEQMADWIEENAVPWISESLPELVKAPV